MAETIPLKRDGRALAIKVLEGTVENYRVAVTIPASQGRVRFLLEGTRVDGELRWLHADSQSLRAMADERVRVTVGTYQKADGTHELDWLICPGYPEVARESREALIRQTWREMPTTLKFLGFGSAVAGLMFLLMLKVPSGWVPLFGIAGVLAVCVAAFALVMGIGEIATLWNCFRRRRVLELMESVRGRYLAQSAVPAHEHSTGESHVS
ncbi:hypothetical protein PQR52_36820 [Paraburkholderia aspalathi]|uniref:hypothetical protein n=1 Tax=Paraburkholderia aspalathi TaxID=1324617 RepID=UPI0038BC9E37